MGTQSNPLRRSKIVIDFFLIHNGYEIPEKSAHEFGYTAE